MKTYTLQNCGCYVDGARGIHTPAKIVMFANQHGARIVLSEDAEQDADEHMNRAFGVEGAWWGRNENGDWGLWAVETEAVA